MPERRRAEIKALADQMMKPLAAVEQEVYQTQLRSNQDALNFPIKLNNKIAALAGVIEASDSKPTDQSYAVFKELNAALDKLLAQRDDVLKRELTRVNAAIRRQRLEPIDPAAKPAAPAPKPPTQ